jgi:hypothetical protein
MTLGHTHRGTIPGIRPSSARCVLSLPHPLMLAPPLPLPHPLPPPYLSCMRSGMSSERISWSSVRRKNSRCTAGSTIGLLGLPAAGALDEKSRESAGVTLSPCVCSKQISRGHAAKE